MKAWCRARLLLQRRGRECPAIISCQFRCDHQQNPYSLLALLERHAAAIYKTDVGGPIMHELERQCAEPIGVTDMIQDPWIGFAVLAMFTRACTLGAIAAHLSSSEYGAGLGLLYTLAKLAEYIIDERAKVANEHAAGTLD